MKKKAHISILLFFLLAFPFQTAYACGNSSENVIIEVKLCDSTMDHSTLDIDCCENRKGDCDGACKNTSCSCPSSITLSQVEEGFKASTSSAIILLYNQWQYSDHFPKDVHLSIWQPPKIS